MANTTFLQSKIQVDGFVDKNGIAGDGNQLLKDNGEFVDINSLTPDDYARQGSGDTETVNLTNVDGKIGDVNDILSAITGGDMELDLPSDYATVQDVTEAKNEIIASFNNFFDDITYQSVTNLLNDNE